MRWHRGGAPPPRKQPPPSADLIVDSAPSAASPRAESSLLDTEGSLLHGWLLDGGGASSISDGAGAGGLALVCCLIYAVGRALHTGSLFNDGGALALHYISYLHAYARDCAFLAAAFIASTWISGWLVLLAQRSRTPRALRGWLALAHGAMECATLAGCTAYATRCPHWPFMQRVWWLIAATLAACKEHSYNAFIRGELLGAASAEGKAMREERRDAAVAGEGAGVVAAGDGSGMAAATATTTRPTYADALRGRRASQGTPAAAASATCAVTAATEVCDAPQLAALPRLVGAPVPSPLAPPPPPHPPPPFAPLSLSGLLWWALAPSLVFRPSPPRSAAVRPAYLLEKLALAAWLLVLMAAVLTNAVEPALAALPAAGALRTAARIALPLLAFAACSWLLVFECALNALAELTRFADRRWYGPFWRATTFLEFSRTWNRPVHTFLLRHAYLPLVGAGLPRRAALALTFATSIALHEAILWGAFGRVTFPVLGVMSLCQLPLADLMRARAIQGKPLGNVCVWAGLVAGVACTTALYAQELRVGAGNPAVR